MINETKVRNLIEDFKSKQLGDIHHLLKADTIEDIDDALRDSILHQHMGMLYLDRVEDQPLVNMKFEDGEWSIIEYEGEGLNLPPVYVFYSLGVSVVDCDMNIYQSIQPSEVIHIEGLFNGRLLLPCNQQVKQQQQTGVTE